MSKFKEKIEDIWWYIDRWYTDKFKMFFRRQYWKIKYGFDISETWSLDYSMCKWLFPRLKYFKEHNIGYPVCNDIDGNEFTFEKWNEYIQEMIDWCETVVKDDIPYYAEGSHSEYGTDEMKKKREKFELGEKLFHTYFYSLWW